MYDTITSYKESFISSPDYSNSFCFDPFSITWSHHLPNLLLTRLSLEKSQTIHGHEGEKYKVTQDRVRANFKTPLNEDLLFENRFLGGRRVMMKVGVVYVRTNNQTERVVEVQDWEVDRLELRAETRHHLFQRLQPPPWLVLEGLLCFIRSSYRSQTASTPVSWASSTSRRRVPSRSSPRRASPTPSGRGSSPTRPTSSTVCGTCPTGKNTPKWSESLLLSNRKTCALSYLSKSIVMQVETPKCPGGPETTIRFVFRWIRQWDRIDLWPCGRRV